RVYNEILEFPKATSYLQQGLEFLQSLNKDWKLEEEATLRYEYGLSLFSSDDYENARL
uniref:Uncharacterized protein n=1 Tax=Megaselia scalaris TaxID=36166 RepID=T1GSU8_MEGSC